MPRGDSLGYGRAGVPAPSAQGRPEKAKCCRDRPPLRSIDRILPSAVLLGGKPRQATPLYVGGKPRRFLVRRDPAALATRQRRFGFIDCRQYLQAAPLALFPKCHGFWAGVSCTSIAFRVKVRNRVSSLAGLPSLSHFLW